MTERVYLHLGPFKTGSTYIQGSLRGRRQELADQGLLFPLAKGRQHQRAAIDLLGRSKSRRSTAPVKGGWDDAVAEIKAWEGSTAVISCEVLSAATSQAVDRAVESLAPAEVHVVVTMRNLASLIPSFWQSNMRNRKYVTWQEFTASLRGEEGAEPKFGERFWRSMDASALLGLWSERVPADRLHVVVMPSGGAPPELLWQRFMAAVGVQDVPKPATDTAKNVAVGTEQAEALRRLNAGLAGNYPHHLYVRYVKRVATSGAVRAATDSRKMVLPPEDFEWVRDQSQRIADDIAKHGYQVFGDLAEAIPTAPSVVTPDGPFRPDDVRVEKVIEAATNMSLALLLHLQEKDRGGADPDDEDVLIADLDDAFDASLGGDDDADGSRAPEETPAMERLTAALEKKQRDKKADRVRRRKARRAAADSAD